jgi:hypothetical protein
MSSTLQSGTVRDIVNTKIYQSDGSTPFDPVGNSSTYIIVTNPSGINSNQIVPTVLVNQGTALDTIVSFPTTASTFPTAGIYQIEWFVLYPSGQLTKSRVWKITILASVQ